MQYYIRTVKNAVIVSAIICTVITLVNWIPRPNFNFYDFVFSKGMLEGFMTGFFLYLGNAFGFAAIRKLMPDDTSYIKRMLTFIPVSILITVLVVFGIQFTFFSVLENHSLTQLIEKQKVNYYINIVVLSVIIYVTVYNFNFYKYYKESQINKQATIAEEATAKFESLKNQIDPHFLFNSLSVLTGLIEENPKKSGRLYPFTIENLPLYFRTKR